MKLSNDMELPFPMVPIRYSVFENRPNEKYLHMLSLYNGKHQVDCSWEQETEDPNPEKWMPRLRGLIHRLEGLTFHPIENVIENDHQKYLKGDIVQLDNRKETSWQRRSRNLRLRNPKRKKPLQPR